MALAKVEWHPSDRQLRQFAVCLAVALPAFLWFWMDSQWAIVASAAGIGAAVAIVGWWRPRWLAPLFVGLSLAVWPVGWLVSELLLLVVFLLLFWPMGWLRRSLGGDPLERNFNREAESYLRPKAQPPDAGSYFRQF